MQSVNSSSGECRGGFHQRLKIQQTMFINPPPPASMKKKAIAPSGARQPKISSQSKIYFSLSPYSYSVLTIGDRNQ
ncbi:MAG TPA: hypothetical protein DCZ55_33735 [Cyanobacteria bacterium UBA11371]|nr:hypothetical protein [Cyanobacteria bacterium UBA11371]